MNASEEDRIPHTPTHTLRSSGVGFLGIEGADFNELWPLFAGAVVSTGLSVAFVASSAETHWHWMARTACALAPVVLAYGYLRLLVHGRPPHFKEDLWRTFRGVEVSLQLARGGQLGLPSVRTGLGLFPARGASVSEALAGRTGKGGS